LHEAAFQARAFSASSAVVAPTDVVFVKRHFEIIVTTSLEQQLRVLELFAVGPAEQLVQHLAVLGATEP
jgi:hypothetical protein